MLDNFRDFGVNTLRGLVAINAPTIFKGIIVEILRKNNITVDVIIDLVTNDGSLWSKLPPEHYSKIKKTASQIGDMKWLTTPYLIDAIKKDHTAIASLFLGWRKSRFWLDRQIKEIKQEIAELE